MTTPARLEHDPAVPAAPAAPGRQRAALSPLWQLAAPSTQCQRAALPPPLQRAAMPRPWWHAAAGPRGADSTRTLRGDTMVVRGYTMVELLTAVAVVAILAVVAIPSYSAYVVRAKRAQAKTSLVQAAQYLERVYSQSGCYSYTDANSCAKGAATPPGLLVIVPATTATDYAVAFMVAPTATANGQSYTLAATPCGAGPACAGGSTFTDAVCGALTLDNAGAKGALGVSPTLTTSTAPVGPVLAAIQQCWDR